MQGVLSVKIEISRVCEGCEFFVQVLGDIGASSPTGNIKMSTFVGKKIWFWTLKNVALPTVTNVMNRMYTKKLCKHIHAKINCLKIVGFLFKGCCPTEFKHLRMFYHSFLFAVLFFLTLFYSYCMKIYGQTKNMF